MTGLAMKTPYIIVVKNNLKELALSARINLRKIYDGFEVKFRRQAEQIEIYQDNEIIDEIEQNRINEELEKCALVKS